jgi:hypothetical protein
MKIPSGDEYQSIRKGYQPSRELNRSTPPQGGSGLSSNTVEKKPDTDTETSNRTETTITSQISGSEK